MIVYVLPADARPDRRSSAVDLVLNMVFGVLLFGPIYAALSVFWGEGVVEGAVGGAVLGALFGVVWSWDSRRSRAFRSRFDPTAQILTRRTSTAGDEPPRESIRPRRYGPRRLVVVAAAGWAAFLALAVFLTADAETSVRDRVSAWGVTAVYGGFLVAFWLTYTEVGHGGLRVRTPLKRQTIAWTDLAQVRWRRDAHQDVLVFCTNDGREIKAVGVGVSGTGVGKKRALRMLADVEKTWAGSF